MRVPGLRESVTSTPATSAIRACWPPHDDGRGRRSENLPALAQPVGEPDPHQVCPIRPKPSTRSLAWRTQAITVASSSQTKFHIPLPPPQPWPRAGGCLPHTLTQIAARRPFPFWRRRPPVKRAKKFFAAAKRECLSEALELASASPCDPRDAYTRRPRAIWRARARLSHRRRPAPLHWLSKGFGYEVTGFRLLDSLLFEHSPPAAIPQRPAASP